MLKKMFLLFFVATVFLLGAGAGAALAAKGKGMTSAMREAGFTAKTAQWTSVTTQTRGNNKPEKTMVKFWLAGEKFRMEMQDRRTKETMIMIDDGQDQYLYDPKKKSAMKLEGMMKNMYSGFFNSDAFKQAAEQRKTAKKIGTETISGKPCTVYTYDSRYQNFTSKVKEWVWNGKNFPMKSIVTSEQQTMVVMGNKTTVPASTTETLITEVVLDKPIPASMFQVPAGAKTQSMGRGADAEEETGEDEESGGEPQEMPKEVKDMMKNLF